MINTKKTVYNTANITVSFGLKKYMVLAKRILLRKASTCAIEGERIQKEVQHKNNNSNLFRIGFISSYPPFVS